MSEAAGVKQHTEPSKVVKWSRPPQPVQLRSYASRFRTARFQQTGVNFLDFIELLIPEALAFHAYAGWRDACRTR
jgi:hypothetical protein